jgi:integrative and conjugative element protein (TIGR02256 family)
METGGVLLGSVRGAEAHVGRLIGPGPAAEHERRSFTPDQEWQAAEVAAAWAANPASRYLGDWHTHPSGAARLSEEDVAAMRIIAANADARNPEPFMLVVALAGDGTVRLGGGRLRGRSPRPMRAVVHVETSRRC